MHKTLTQRLHKVDTFLYGFLNIPREEFMLNQRVCGLYLKRLKECSRHAGSPERGFKYIHVTGTSGKGSTTLMIESILRAAGHTVGCYTSPHITTRAERILVNGRMVHVSDFEEASAIIKKATQRMMETSPLSIPSYFELDFLIALLIFKKYKVEYAVAEVGCGGRYDATNIIPAPTVTVITNIGLDHTHILGKTKTKIAHEKVGIVKKGSHVIIGERTPLIQKQLARESFKVGAASVTYVPAPTRIKSTKHGVSFFENKRRYDVSLHGAHQAHNARLALSVAKLLNISEHTTQKGLAHTLKIGAFEIVSHNPLVIIDGAHNNEKIATTAEALRHIKQQYKADKVHCILGMAENKDHKQALRILIPGLDKLYVTRFTNNYFRKSYDPRTLLKTAKTLTKIPTQAFLFPDQALDAALHNARKNDIILVTGSLFLAGELRARWFPEEQMLKKRKMTW